MKTFKTIGLVGSLLAGSVFATSASAVTVDFAGMPAIWNAGGTSISSGNVTVASTGGNISWENDGLGVTGGQPDSEPDEVDNAETLLVSFTNAVQVTSIWLDDFWNSTNSNTAERARVTVNGGPSFELVATKPTNGLPDPTVFDFAALFAGPVSSLLFEAVNLGSPSNLASDYALARIDYETAPVPVPAAFWLLGSAMVFLFRKRQTG